MRPQVTLYTRKGCCLCDAAQAVLAEASKLAEFDCEEIDIDSDAELRGRYNDEVPVVAINGKPVFRYQIDMQEFLKRLGAHQ